MLINKIIDRSYLILVGLASAGIADIFIDLKTIQIPVLCSLAVVVVLKIAKYTVDTKLNRTGTHDA